MTLDESTENLARLQDASDLELAASAVLTHGRAVVEHAAHAGLPSLYAARAAGHKLTAQLIEERRRLVAELRQSQSLHDSLASNLPEESPRSYFLG